MFKTKPEISRMGCLFPVHQLIFRGALPTTWHWDETGSVILE